MPKDNITRALKKGTGELGGGNVEEIVYEGYANHGVAVMCDIMTDNRNRTAPEIRKMFEIHNGNLGATNCVGWIFNRKGLFLVLAENVNEEQLIEVALEAGADDIRETDGQIEITRQYDPECLSCHTTGWQPQQYTPFSSGFESMTSTQHLAGSGCENCHGPGSEHVRLERLELLDEVVAAGDLLSARQALQVSIARAKEHQCATCHDLDNSPDFHDEGAFEKYWTQIEH